MVKNHLPIIANSIPLPPHKQQQHPNHKKQSDITHLVYYSIWNHMGFNYIFNLYNYSYYRIIGRANIVFNRHLWSDENVWNWDEQWRFQWKWWEWALVQLAMLPRIALGRTQVVSGIHLAWWTWFRSGGALHGEKHHGGEVYLVVNYPRSSCLWVSSPWW